MNALSTYIDHTLLSPVASETDIRKICEEAWKMQFKAICIAPSYVPYVVEMMEFCPVKIEIATVIGFPLGYSVTSTKISEAETALKDGATELDVVMNLSRFKSMAYLSVREEIQQLTQIAHSSGALIKVIIETAYLDTFELYTACEICAEASADFVKTSTGFATAGADAGIVKVMREILPPHVKIKASGGIKTAAQAKAMIEAGAERIGTSQGPAILGII
ncbi:deoxyribose-phosphate aldolase [Dyadobacter aurulentus]|uniref:deoxyribose-phosphate aldolase n=1 Tax=Dyadobacter sp. UC 10 TaxID=2605428 RepID=UPI0011F15D02|nr:deoxyribose-phosphate aldolase [Dyadobacter sp. UC 10]KAA0990502.1 deoxyribose-phosphate aldolase [Dyadobacter sp. UC 10]